MVVLNTPLRRQRKSTACVFYCDKRSWVTAFADVAELIMGVSVDEFGAFDDAGRKRIAWGGGGVRGMKCNMTIGKTVGEMYTNYTVESVGCAGYLP